nr:unnamed protein product [Callosobruchus chinensis]
MYKTSISSILGKLHKFPITVVRSYSNSVKKNHYDIIISGGGMVGASLACTLGKNTKLSNKKILLLEAGKEKQYNFSDKYSNRVVSLNPATYKLLNDINAWQHIKNTRYATVKRLQVWDAVSDACITFGDDNAVEDISYIVENDLLLDAVSKELKPISNLEVFYNTKAKNYSLPEYNDDIVKITLEDGSTYTCNLLLGCDGFNSQVRKAMQTQYVTWNYDQMGLVATLELSEEIENVIAWQRFLPTGPIAFLPLNSNQSSLVWSNTPEEAKKLVKMSETEFVDAINNAVYQTYQHSDVIDAATKVFDNFLRFFNWPVDMSRRYPPKISRIEEGSRAAFPFGFGHSTSYICKGVALVGDAAHRIHPLAGQGVNLGFGDIICLNEVLGTAVNCGSTINDLSFLKDYETERQRHNVPTMLAIDGLYRLYNNDFAPIVLLRSLGLQATHAMNPVKDKVIDWASV